jgi:hypothetical protein
MVGPPSHFDALMRNQREGIMPEPDQSKIEYTSGAGCFIRLYWTILGNVALAITFAMLLYKYQKFPSLVDAACLLLVSSLVCARYIDIRYYVGETADGKPATMVVWKRYSLLLVIGSVCVWLAIRILVPLFAK